MINIDWPTAAAIVGAVATFSSFMYAIFRPKKIPIENLEKIKNIEKHMDDLKNDINIFKEEIRQDLCNIRDEDKDERRILEKKFYRTLERLEDKVEKFTDLVIKDLTER